jgi:ribosomal protein S17
MSNIVAVAVEMKTSAEWYRQYIQEGGHVRIYSAHGWTRSDIEGDVAVYWQTRPITKHEFDERFYQCTITTNTTLYQARHMPFTGELILSQ